MPPDFQSLARDAEFLHRFRSTLVDRDDVFTFGSSDHGPGFNDTLVCLDRASGAVRWEFGGRNSPFDILGPACVDDRRVYVGRNNGTLYALRRDSGEETWRFPVDGGLAMPCFHEGRLLVSTAGGVVPVETGSGAPGPAVPWMRIPSGGRVVALSHAALLFHAGSDGGLMAAPGTWPGNLWHEVAFAHWFSPAILYCAPRSGGLLATDLGDGRALWRADAGTDIRRLLADGGTLWASGAGDVIAAFDALTGEPRWSRKLGTASSMAAWRGKLFLDLNARVAVLDGATGETTGEFALEGAPSGPLLAAGGALYVGRAAEPDVVLWSVPLEPGAPRWRAVIGGYGLS